MRSSALWRIRHYVRPYRGRMIAMTVAALVAIMAALAIPEVSRRLIDGPVANGDRDGILPLALLVLAFGCVDAVLAFMRRYILSYAAIGMETDIRNDLYAHLQRLPVSFHDGAQSGQLLSRAMGDISIIRRFIGFGLVFLVVNGITLLMVLALLARLHMGLAILVGAASVPLIWLGRMFAHDYHKVARQLQDQDGDLTTIIEEGATGIRIIKAFGRQRLMADRFHGAAQPLWETSMEKVRLRGRFFAVLGIIPNLTLAMVVCGGAYAVGNGSLTIGGLVEFVQLVLISSGPSNRSARSCRCERRRRRRPSASSRSSTPSQPLPTAMAPATSTPSRDACVSRMSCSATRPHRTPRATRRGPATTSCSTGCASTSSRARRWRSSA